MIQKWIFVNFEKAIEQLTHAYTRNNKKGLLNDFFLFLCLMAYQLLQVI